MLGFWVWKFRVPQEFCLPVDGILLSAGVPQRLRGGALRVSLHATTARLIYPIAAQRAGSAFGWGAARREIALAGGEVADA